MLKTLAFVSLLLLAAPTAASAAPPDTTPPTTTPVDSTTTTTPVDSTTTTTAPPSTVPPEVTPPSTTPAVSGPTKPREYPGGWPVRQIVFPVAGHVTFYDDWAACRDSCSRFHIGNDLIGVRMQPLLAATDSVVLKLVSDNSKTAGFGLVLQDKEGWKYKYFHVNNDDPGTDNMAQPEEWRYAPGIVPGAIVHAGQVVAYMGDSGNSEYSVPHLHFEIHAPGFGPINPFKSLVNAQETQTCSYIAPASTWDGGLVPGGITPDIAVQPPLLVVKTLNNAGEWRYAADHTITGTGSALFVGKSKEVLPACPATSATVLSVLDRAQFEYLYLVSLVALPADINEQLTLISLPVVEVGPPPTPSVSPQPKSSQPSTKTGPQ